MSFKQQRLVLRSNQSASTSASIEFKSVIDSNFSVYLLKVRDLVSATTARAPLITFSTDNGATYLNSAYRYGGTFSDSTAATGNIGSSGSAAFIQLFGTSISSTSSNGASMDIYFYNLNSGVLVPKLCAYCVAYTSASRVTQWQAGGQNDGTTAVTAVKFAMSSAANITSGKFYFYGVNES